MIRESIVTTLSPAGEIHIAPIGVIVEGELLIVAPFRPSGTLDNLLGSRHAVVNYVEDVRVFAGCVTGAHRDWPTRKAEHVAGAIIEGSLAYDEIELLEIEDDETRPRLSCRSIHRQMLEPFLGFNRAQASVIEASILTSRLTMLPREKIEREMAYLAIAIDKTAGPREREAWSWLANRIESYFAATQPQS